jgi:hypothetical protein
LKVSWCGGCGNVTSEWKPEIGQVDTRCATDEKPQKRFFFFFFFFFFFQLGAQANAQAAHQPAHPATRAKATQVAQAAHRIFKSSALAQPTRPNASLVAPHWPNCVSKRKIDEFSDFFFQNL